MQVTTSGRALRRHIPRLLLALLATITLAWGGVAPTPIASAATTYKAPTGVKVAAISGTNGLKVTWTASTTIDGSATSPTKYLIKYGTSSSRKTTKTYSVSETALIYVISGLSTSTSYYVWIAATDDTGLPISAWSSAVKATTSSYRYKAPVEIFAVNATKTTIEIAWRTVTGAPAYRLQAVGGGETKWQSTGSDGTAIFKGLKPATSYTFTVSVMQPATTSVPSEVKMSPESSSKAVKSTTPASNLDAPTNLKATDQDHASLTLAWTAPSGYDADAHEIRIDYAEDQIMKDNFKQQYLNGASGAVLKSLSANTNYYVRAVVVSKPDASGIRVTLSDRTEAILAKTRSPKGFIAGKVTGVSGPVLRDYVVAAYSASTGDVNQQVTPDDDGDYKIELRPGDYYLQAIYIGSGNHTTLWARQGTPGARTRTDLDGAATKVTVTIGKTPVVAPTITVGQGGTIKGTVTCPGQGTNDSCSVDVAAISSAGSTPAVIGQTRSDDDGNYSITGLTPGNYKVRFNHTEERFRIATKEGALAGAGDTVDVDQTLTRRNFIRTYALTMGGTKAVGKTLSVSSKAPLASEYPTVRAFASYQWQINGHTKSTSSTFKPSSAYRGAYVRVVVTYYRFGFTSVTKVSQSYRLA